MLGSGKESWMAALEKENYLKATEMSIEDDYGMIDGIINNGPKEDKTLDAKAPDTGEKSSIMDRLKSAKAGKPKEGCVMQKNRVFNLFHYLFQQGLVTVHHVIDHISVADCFEMLSCAVNFRFLDEAELHGRHRSFRFGNEIDMLDGAFIESNRPVRVIVSDRRCNIEAVRQFHINRNIRVGVQIGREIMLVRGIIHNMIV